MACDLAPQCNFLYEFFQCNLPEDTIDVEVTVRTLRGIHNFRKTMPHNCPHVACEEHKLNPFHHWLRRCKHTWKREETLWIPFLQPRDTLIDQAHHPFQKKTTLTKRSKFESRRSQKKLCKFRRIDGRCFIHTNAVKPTFTQQPAFVMIPQAATTDASIFEQLHNSTCPTRDWTIPTDPNLLYFGHTCLVGSALIMSPNNPEWSEVEEEDWDGEKQKEKEHKEEESKDSEQ